MTAKKKPASRKKASSKKEKKKSAPRKRAFPRKPARKKAWIAVNVTLREHLTPLDRGDRYEDAIYEALEEAGLGGPGDGGGTLCAKNGEIEEADFDVELSSADVVSLLVRMLEERGAAKGSRLRYEQDGRAVVVPFGITEAVAIYLDGVTLPDEVYKSTSTQELFDRLAVVLGDDLDCRGSWQGQRETALYFNGLDAEDLFATMEPILRDYPLSRNARVVVRHRLPDAREVRLGNDG